MAKRHPQSALRARLARFAKDQDINTKGPLGMVLVITRRASKMTPPFKPEQFVTKQGGQVAGLGKGAVQSVLEEHGVRRVLAEEGGRTSRGNMGRMSAYVAFLNELAADGLLDFAGLERWWVDRILEYFAAMPLVLRVDPAMSIKWVVGELMEAAFARQRACSGTMVVGAVMQHLVGAKLEICLPDERIQHRGVSVADAAGGERGDFVIGDTVIHVTTAPTEALIRKCFDNLNEAFRPVVVTTQSGAGGAEALARDLGIADRIDILDIEQFVTANIHEWSGFSQASRGKALEQLVATYNRIVEDCETDPSLRIAIG